MVYTILMLIFHIVIALGSIIIALVFASHPSTRLQKMNITLKSATIVTGIALVANGYSMLHMCISGLVFVAAVGVLSVVGERRLSANQL